MRKLRKSTSVTLLLGVAQATSAANLVTNPDFDTDVSGWNASPGTSITLQTGSGTPAPSAGFASNSSSGGTVRSSCIQIGTAQNVDFSLAILTISPINKYARVNAYGDVGCSAFISGVAQMAVHSNVWKVFSASNFALPQGTQGVEIEIGVDNIGNVIFDHVLFGPTGTAPVGLQSFDVN